MQILSNISTSLVVAASLASLLPTAEASAYKMKGCWKNVNGLTSKGMYKWQSAGHCAIDCDGYAVMVLTNGNDCSCTDTMPSDKDKTDDGDCDTPCDGYPDDICGSDQYYSVYLTGNKKPKYASDTTTSKASTTTSSTATSTSSKASTTAATKTTSPPTLTTSVLVTSTAANPAGTATATSPAQASQIAEPEEKSGGKHTAAIAAGVVVGIVAAAGVVGGLLFWRRRRNRERVEEEYRRNAQLSDYVAGGTAASAARGAGGQEKYGHDQRLDPSAQRRLSSGSIADDQDYSRRILKVTNPDSGYY